MKGFMDAIARNYENVQFCYKAGQSIEELRESIRIRESRKRLRDDLLLLPITTPFSPRIAPERLALTRQAARKRPLYVMFVERRDWMNELMRDCLERLEPEVEWRLEGQPVLAIYRYVPPDVPDEP